ncbi:endolytic transglycosylase MltG [Kitasatospora sp. NBC_01287]|uniref:endolytic transglycosylase MltG n=1 Tax=Kitasatospora sp. NBC_01287 TaxID=2903573 RepID=UPI0022589489|nr:endolytic transglycosylase MltG [Kitasatospora sp. NBC_01287]MCX4745110.1 endolytic transglycosylase MltG [Kitasatospora sp. NBC_01287]
MDQDAMPGLTPGHLGAPPQEPQPQPLPSGADAGAPAAPTSWHATAADLAADLDPQAEPGGEDEPPPTRPDRTRLACGLTLLLLVLLVGGALLTARAFFTRSGPTRPADFAGAGSGAVVEISVPQGATLTTIGRLLQANQVVASVEGFVDAAGTGVGSTRIQPGTYALKHRMSSQAALGVLDNPANANALTIPEGRRASQVYPAVDQRLGLPAGSTEQIAKQHLAELGLPDYAGGNIEGLLFPSTYTVTKDTTALGLLQEMVKRGTGAYSDAGLDHPMTGGLTPYQALVVASLVQGESDNPDDMAKVARVIYNRLARAMPLQLDSTINYALGRTTLHTSVTDTQLDSPFNTYRAPGLPPTPIDNPGPDALHAALEPAAGDWIYFVTVRPGDTRFTDSEQQQRKNVDEFNAYQAKHGASPSGSPTGSPAPSGH